METIKGKPNQKVTIYRDPLTKKQSEGQAVLIQFLGKASYPPYEETWRVQFKGDFGCTYERVVIFGD
jgi:hypothetical protein